MPIFSSNNLSGAGVIVASAARISLIDIHNTGAAVAYVKLYNKATTPAPASDVPAMRIAIPAASSKVIQPPSSISAAGIGGFAAGLSYNAVTGVADTDTTAPAANQIIANIVYQPA